MTTKRPLGVVALVIALSTSLSAQTPAIPMPQPGAPAGPQPGVPANPSPNASLLPPLPMPPRMGEQTGEVIQQPHEPSVNLPPLMPLAPTVLTPGMPSCSSCGTGHCTDPGCDGWMPRGPKDPVWINFTQLLLWFQPSRSPFPIAASGGQTLLDGQAQLGMYKAGMIDGGMWLDKEHTFGIGMGLMMTEHRSGFDMVAGGPGGTTIQRPFIDAVTGLPTTLFVSNGNPANGVTPFAGSIATAVTARLSSADIGVRRNMLNTENFKATLMFGMRYLDLDESLTVYQTSNPTTDIPASVGRPLIPAGSTIQLMDRAYTRNQFYGGEVGGQFEYTHGLVFIAVTPRLAFGPVHQVTQISGQTQVMGAAPQTLPGALLAAGANGDGNLNRFVTNRFSVLSQIGAEVGVKITNHIRTSVGYQFLYLNDTARPGGQLSQVINQRVVPVSTAFGTLSGPQAPNVTFDREGFYAHGVAFKLQITY